MNLGSWALGMDPTQKANAGSALAPFPARVCLSTDIVVACPTQSMETLNRP